MHLLQVVLSTIVIVLSVFVLSSNSNPRLSFEQLCKDPSFDEAVSISEQYILLFKDDFVWLLDLLTYQVSPFFQTRTMVDACFGQLNLSSGALLFAWNRYDDLRYFHEQICFNKGNQTCMMTVKLSSNDFEIFFGYPHNFTQSRLDNNDFCHKDVGENTIEIVLRRESFDGRSNLSKKIWLSGRHFKTHISFTPVHYDPSLVIFKIELFKLFREFDSEHDYQNKENIIPDNAGGAVTSNISDDQHLENVYAFTVLPHGEMMIFFAQQFCYIGYYNMECNRRETTSLIGCTMPKSVPVHKYKLHFAKQPAMNMPDKTVQETTVTTNDGKQHSSKLPNIFTRFASTSSSIPAMTKMPSRKVNFSFSHASTTATTTVLKTVLPTAGSISAVTSGQCNNSSDSKSSKTQLHCEQETVNITSSPMSAQSNQNISLGKIVDADNNHRIRTTNVNALNLSNSSEIDFFDQKRRAFKRGTRIHARSSFELTNLHYHFQYLMIGFKLFKFICIRTFFVYVSTTICIMVIITIILAAIYRWYKYDYQVLLFVCKFTFLQKLCAL